MAFLSSAFVCFILFLFIHSVSSAQNSLTPPRGWNSYGAYSWRITQRQFVDNVDELYKNYRTHGYEYAVVDAFWYRNLEHGTDSIDEWGRPIPDIARWPSSHDGKGFSVVSNTVHTLGLKFGISVISGISGRAVDWNTPILDINTGTAYRDQKGRKWYARSIALRSQPCSYAPGFLAIDTTRPAAKVFLNSLYTMYASWGVDFVKIDCVFGDHYNIGEITAVSEIIHGLRKPMVISLSPGVGANTVMGTDVSLMVNMYRKSPNNWDQWGILKSQFDRARNFAAVGIIGIEGLMGNSWPDLDILPFGWLAESDWTDGPQRKSNLTVTEQVTEMTLWSMTKSPLMIGGDLKTLDFRTQLLVTNPTLLEINSYSSNNMEYPSDVAGVRGWIATGRNGEVYVALFNIEEAPIDYNLNVSYVGTAVPDLRFSNCSGSDLWNPKNTVVNGTSKPHLVPHSSALFVLNCTILSRPEKIKRRPTWNIFKP